MPLSSVWAGPARNEHLAGRRLLFAQTSGSTPFRLSTHVGDVGHMLVVGPTGAGKSVLLALLAMQFRRYRARASTCSTRAGRRAPPCSPWAARIMRSARAAGEGEGALAFQPLRRIDEPAAELGRRMDRGLLEHEKVAVTPEVKDGGLVGARQPRLGAARGADADRPVAAAPVERAQVGAPSLHARRAVRALLDAAEDRLALADVQCFETEALMGQAGAVLPVLTYLFHRLEERFDGSPTLLVLDEAWLFLDNPLFAARIREWLKVLRKKNVAVVFATQSLADIADSSIAPAIIESCPQRIFLPNDRAVEPQARAAYERFGLNERQIELIARATPKRDYYLQSRRGNRLFDLGLGRSRWLSAAPPIPPRSGSSTRS
jgi:ABC-type uncharacterized transport system YnjBCD ATPase subunit